MDTIWTPNSWGKRSKDEIIEVLLGSPGRTMLEPFLRRPRKRCKSLPAALAKARVFIEEWRNEYNQTRPHSALNYRPPAPDAPTVSYLAYFKPNLCLWQRKLKRAFLYFIIDISFYRYFYRSMYRKPASIPLVRDEVLPWTFVFIVRNLFPNFCTYLCG